MKCFMNETDFRMKTNYHISSEFRYWNVHLSMFGSFGFWLAFCCFVLPKKQTNKYGQKQQQQQ